MFITQVGNKVLDRLRGSSFWRNVAVLAGGTATSQLLSFVTTPIITRLYEPEDFGLVAVYTSILGFAAAFVCLSYQYAVLNPDDESDAANLLALCMLIAIGFSVIAVFIICFWANDIAQLLREPRIACYLWFIPLSILLVGFYAAFNFWAVRNKAFTHIAQTKLSQSVSALIAKTALGIFDFRPLGLFIGTIMSESAGTMSLMRSAWTNNQQSLKLITFSGVRRVARRYIRFPLLTTPTALINAAGTNLPTMLLTVLYGSQVTGWFSLARRLTLIPISLVGQAIGQVYLGEIALLAHTHPQKMRDLFMKTCKRLALVSLFPASVFMLGGARFVRLLLGQEWNETGVYLQFLSISFVVGFVATPVSQVFSLLERQDLALLWNIARLVLIAISLYIAKILGLPARMAILFFGVSMMLVDVCRIFLVSRIIRTTK